MSVPVIDLFAGPGGLGEGFSRCESTRFDIAVSIEKDEMAFRTLQLRAAHRALLRRFGGRHQSWSQWDSIVALTPWNDVFKRLSECGNPAIAAACEHALSEAWHLELGPEMREQASLGIRRRLAKLVGGEHFPKNTVLIGGPPCQAYSVVGRSRNKGTAGYSAENDHRHFLYKEYLQVIKEFKPAVFVMENVKGILTSKVNDKSIFELILSDLQRPDLACGFDESLHYQLIALPNGSNNAGMPASQDFIVEAERYGVPQARHRVIICGVRRDVFERAGRVDALAISQQRTVAEVLSDLPPLRPALSFRGKGLRWNQSFNLPIADQAIGELKATGDTYNAQIAKAMEVYRFDLLNRADPGTGSERLRLERQVSAEIRALQGWYADRPLQVLANHESRSHMPEDLVRYLFVSTYGRVKGQSPRLEDFPKALLPKHKNIDPDTPSAAIFKDRFRVQIATNCSMTVTSHIGKDGHAFIHYDPSQARSMTVREAARLQTFPDSYVFLGNRTSQYTQVGNAVPPLLAKQIAQVVGYILARAGLT